MQKSIVLSLHQEWWEKMLSGEKTLEIRKTKPDLSSPFTVYVYKTKAGKGTGTVVGFFRCTGIIKIDNILEAVAQGSCLKIEDLYAYADGRMLYGWNIKNVIKYDMIFLSIYQILVLTVRRRAGFM